MSVPFGFREFVRPRIPVISEPNVSDDALGGPVVSKDIALDWGRTSFLNFNLELGPQKPRVPPPATFVVRPPENYLIERHGVGVAEAKNRDGSVAQESNPDFNEYLLFFIKDFIEYTEEVKTSGGVTTVQPIETHVKLYLLWEDLGTISAVPMEIHLVPG